MRVSLHIAERTAEHQRELAYHRSTVQQYQTIISTLNQVRREDQPDPLLQKVRWRQATLQLALAYNDLGYYERRFNHLSDAERYYREALRHYSEIGDAEVQRMRAITHNNAGFALMLQGEAERGLQQVERAEEIFRSEGALQRVAISQNTRAQILTEQGRLDDALRAVNSARQTLETASDQRYFGLCLRAEGDIRRRLATDKWEQHELSESEFDLALACYQGALPKLVEHQRRVQVRHERGITYRDRGRCRQRRGEPIGDDFEQARTWLNQALEFHRQQLDPTKPNAQLAHLYHDMAVLHFFQDDLVGMNQFLERSRSVIPEQYHVLEGVGLNATSETSQQVVYWLRLGQIEFQQAQGLFRQGKPQAACEALLRAIACVQEYNRSHPFLNTIRRLSRENLRQLGDAAQIQELQDQTYFQAIIYKLTGPPFDELASLFEEVLGEIELL